MARNDPQLPVRIPAPLLRQLKLEAAAESRSMTAQLVVILRERYAVAKAEPRIRKTGTR